MLRESSTRKIPYLIGALLALVVFYWIILSITRQGETRVTITVVPNDSKIFINNQPAKPGTAYLKPGEYTLKASRSGFKDDVQTIKVGDKPVDTGLIPRPDSDSARKFLEDNPTIQAQREAIGGQRANQKGQQIESKSPIITLLPFTDIAGPFSIDYGPSPDRKDGVFLIVSDSSPEGRTNALRWIKQQGYDPTELEIRFYDFNSPLTPSESN